MGLSPVLNTFIGYSGGLESDWNFCFESYGTKFEISTVTESCGETERFYLDSLQQAIKAHNDSAEATIIDEVADWLAELCQPWFRRHKPIHFEKRLRTLLDVLCPSRVILCLRNEDGEPYLEELGEHPFLRDVRTPCDAVVDSTLPLIKPSDIAIVETKASYIFKAYVHGSITCVKTEGLHTERSIWREIVILQYLAENPIHCGVHFPYILELVRSEFNDEVIGFLMNHIEARGTLASLRAEAFPRARRLEWGRQIKAAVHALHDHGQIWGDVKPDNILVDMHGRLWITDFGGGTTTGWVDERLIESIEGDLQGVNRIFEFLHIAEQGSRTVAEYL